MSIISITQPGRTGIQRTNTNPKTGYSSPLICMIFLYPATIYLSCFSFNSLLSYLTFIRDGNALLVHLLVLEKHLLLSFQYLWNSRYIYWHCYDILWSISFSMRSCWTSDSHLSWSGYFKWWCPSCNSFPYKRVSCSDYKRMPKVG